jgi:hypothetical protein
LALSKGSPGPLPCRAHRRIGRQLGHELVYSLPRSIWHGPYVGAKSLMSPIRNPFGVA